MHIYNPSTASYCSPRVEVLGLRNDYGGGALPSITADLYSNIMLFNCRKVNAVDRIKILPDYMFIITHPMIKHALSEADRNSRQESCERVVGCIGKKYPHVKNLRSISLDVLKSSKKMLNFTDYKRALHVVSENTLVLKGAEALKDGDMELFGLYLYLSHESFRTNFESSCREFDYLVELSKSIPGCVGAKLSVYGDCITSIHLVKKNEADNYKARIATAFKLQTNSELQIDF